MLLADHWWPVDPESEKLCSRERYSRIVYRPPELGFLSVRGSFNHPIVLMEPSIGHLEDVPDWSCRADSRNIIYGTE
jgi:hypothetical protein